MKVLAFETSTNIGSVAIAENGKLIQEIQNPIFRAHSEFINPAVETLLSKSNWKLSDIDFFACGVGPGSFTGIRVSVTLARTFSLSFNKCVRTLNSLEMLHLNSGHSNSLCLMNAFKNMVYVGIFEGNQLTFGPVAIKVSDLNQITSRIPKNCIGLGDGFNIFKNAIPVELHTLVHLNPIRVDNPLASTLALHASSTNYSGQTLDWNLVIPLYIRASEAEENARK